MSDQEIELEEWLTEEEYDRHLLESIFSPCSHVPCRDCYDDKEQFLEAKKEFEQIVEGRLEEIARLRKRVEELENENQQLRPFISRNSDQDPSDAVTYEEATDE